MSTRGQIYSEELMGEMLRRAKEAGISPDAYSSHYAGTTKACYPLRAPVIGEITRAWVGRHRELTLAEYLALLNTLSRTRIHNQFCLIGSMLNHYPHLRRSLDPLCIDSWLERAEGWAEVDSICQSQFTAEELLSSWRLWKKLLGALSKSENVHKRRASLVLLTKPVRDSADRRLAELAFAHAERLESDPDVLVKKAISWLLRDLTKHHRETVQTYLRRHSRSLPSIAVRETRAKLGYGRKSAALTGL